jgi:hypothetical protein
LSRESSSIDGDGGRERAGLDLGLDLLEHEDPGGTPSGGERSAAA